MLIIILLHFWIKPKYYPAEVKVNTTNDDVFESESLGYFFAVYFVIIAGLGVFSGLNFDAPVDIQVKKDILSIFAIVISVVGLIFYLIVNPIRFKNK